MTKSHLMIIWRIKRIVTINNELIKQKWDSFVVMLLRFVTDRVPLPTISFKLIKVNVLCQSVCH